MSKIELLYFHDCPNWENALELFERVLKDLNINEEIHLYKVESDEEATKRKFTGSPSFYIDGQDLFPSEQENYFLGCRVYPTSKGFRGMPEYEVLRTAVQKALKL
ncbi:DF family (seleno)protein [Bellilinea sp.]|jgi:hypothetical protein|uniref:DF family (seleno)protein n=1 Tax=Bellilinea sp. TaxID=2838785 RepID=UPI002ADD776D|nr:hypothetical protein [Bellilinea sp.]